MPDLAFVVEDIRPAVHAAVPTLTVRLRITNADPTERIQHVALQTQVQLKSMLWTQVNVIVPAFDASTVVDLPVPCSFDFNVAAQKYFDGVEVALRFLFTGTIFYQSADRKLQTAQIPSDREARSHLSVDTWRRMLAIYYPDTEWLCLRRDVFARLYEYKVRRRLPTWEHAMSEILSVFDDAIE